MTTKNRDRLRQFDNSEHVLALLDLPERVFRELKAIHQPSRSDALRALYVLAVAILLNAPLRFGPGDTKTKQPMEMPFPAALMPRSSST